PAICFAVFSNHGRHFLSSEWRSFTTRKENDFVSGSPAASAPGQRPAVSKAAGERRSSSRRVSILITSEVGHKDARKDTKNQIASRADDQEPWTSIALGLSIFCVFSF